MIFNDVDAPALPVMRAQDGRFGVGQPRQILRLGRQHEASERIEFLAGPGCEEVLGDLDQQRVTPATRSSR